MNRLDVEASIQDMIQFDPTDMIKFFGELPVGHVAAWAMNDSGMDLSIIQDSYPFYFTFTPTKVNVDMWNAADDELRKLWLTIKGIEYYLTNEWERIQNPS